MESATQHTLQFIESVTACRPNLRLLEVGCGKGHLAKALVDKGTRFFRSMSPEEAVAFARSLGLPAKQTDILGVNDFAFDGILFIQSLHHINPLDQSLAQAARLLNKGGFVLVDDFAFNQDRRKGRRLVADMLVVRALKISQMIRQLPDGTPPTYDSMH